MKIIHTDTQEDMSEICILFREYEAMLGVNLDFQGFEAELSELPGKYAPPDGLLFLAKQDGRSIGCVALRRLDSAGEHTCEMKRLYVRPEARGLHLGKRLAERLIEEAISLGYCTMVLDTLERLQSANGLYKSLGFTKTTPYYNNPLPGVVYWKLDMNGKQRSAPQKPTTAVG